VSLRTRLVAGFLLVALTLIGADAVVAVLVRRSLVQTLDRRLETQRLPRTATDANPLNPPPGFTQQPGRPANVSDFYLVFVGADGTIDNRTPSIGRSERPPQLPTNLRQIATPVGRTPQPFTVDEQGGGAGYRAVAVQRGGGVLLIAVSLHDTLQTFHAVVIVEVLATVAVLLALAVVAWWVLHLGVRPLDQMARTADAIAAGDLSQRVERAEPTTEAGRLGLALNTMLNEIELAFDQRSESEDRLRRFVADASHELRTPLTSIRGYAELYRQGGLVTDTALADAMRRMEQEAARMGVLVDDLLLLARLDQGRPLETGPVDLAALTRDAVADAQAVEPDRPISLEGPEHVVVEADEHRLRQVVANLLANARVHTPPGTPVRVRIGVAEAGGHDPGVGLAVPGAGRAVVAVLDVEDDGPGFGPEPERVFERFYRTDPARARASGGSGLGLSIVAAVVEAHGGSVRAGATSTGGALVHVELPLSPGAPAAPLLRAAQEPVAQDHATRPALHDPASPSAPLVPSAGGPAAAPPSPTASPSQFA